MCKEEMALAKNVFIVLLAVTASALTEPIDVADNHFQKNFQWRKQPTLSNCDARKRKLRHVMDGDEGEFSTGIPDLFPCKGPSLYSLEKSNTKMQCGGRMCLVHCKPGYRSFTKIPFVYVCHGDGFWTSIPFNNGIEGYTIDWPYCFDNRELQH